MQLNFVAPRVSWNRPLETVPQNGDVIVYNNEWYRVRNKKFDLDAHHIAIYLEPDETTRENVFYTPRG